MYNRKWSFIVTVIVILSITLTILSSEESSEIGQEMEDNKINQLTLIDK
jgi:glycopeptide antibiotics resistance protein